MANISDSGFDECLECSTKNSSNHEQVEQISDFYTVIEGDNELISSPKWWKFW